MSAGPDEVIVVDGNSNDGTPAIAASLGARVVSDGGQGLAAARQLGAELATTDWIFYVDSDAIVDASTLRDLHTAAYGHGYDAVQARLRPGDGRLTYWQAGEAWRRSIQEPDGSSFVIGCQATLVRRKLIVAVRFDETFAGAAEDHDFWFRARQAGASIGHTKDASARHEDRRSLGAFIDQRLWYGKGMARLLYRHGSVAGSAPSLVRALLHQWRYGPFLLVSWYATGIGMVVGFAEVARSAGARTALKRRARP